jgi:hypothetical protein
LKNNKAPSADSMVNELMKHDDCEIRDKLPTIMKKFYETGEESCDFRKISIEPFHRKVLRVSLVTTEPVA